MFLRPVLAMALLLAAMSLQLAALPVAAAPHAAPPAKPRPAPAAADAPRDRVGGDTFGDAFAFSDLPFTDTGSTIGYADDYDGLCWVTPSASPDVVYAFTPFATGHYTFDLCGSAYDTKLLLFSEGEELFGCNDDGYDFGDPCALTSRLDGVFVAAGSLVYVVIDGYDGDAGDYVLTVEQGAGCLIACPPGADDEQEADAAPGVADVVNCGCGCADAPLYTALAGDPDGNATVCLRPGWREPGDRDQDWLWGNAGASGAVHLELSAEADTRILVWDFTECDDPTPAAASAVATDCVITSLDVTLAPGAAFLVLVEAEGWGPPLGLTPHAYDALLTVTGLGDPLPAETMTWSEVKALYR